jgi:hypothetical protein
VVPAGRGAPLPVPSGLPDRVPVALQQLNLKLPGPVLAHWRAQAQAQGLSVRDWLIAQLAPAAGPGAGPAGGSGLAERVAQLEASTAELLQAVAQLQTPRPAPRSPERVLQAAAEVPPGGIETAALADRLGIRRGTLNARIARAGGACEGLELEGWRCLGLRTSARGGPARAVWVPAEA